MFTRIARLATSRPRIVVGIWLALVGLLALRGLGIEGRLSTQSVYVGGTPSKLVKDIERRSFGDEDFIVVLLRGPERDVRAQGVRVAHRLAADDRITVISPWSGGAPLQGLRPRPGVAAIVANVRRRPGDSFTSIVPAVRDRVDAVVRAPVEASLSGPATIAEGMREQALHAAFKSELLAFPILAVTLLLVFGSPVAAAITGMVGGATVAAGRGILQLLTGTVTLDALAPGLMAMMGLALGVDYSLLMVSRFREEVRRGASPEEAATRTITTTGRAVVFAGAALLLAMLVAAQLLPGAIILSAAVAIITASILSVFAALFIVPAALVVAAPHLERWSIRRRRPAGEGLAASLSRRLTRRPLIATFFALFLLAAGTAYGTTVDTGPPSVGLLPPGDPHRMQYEDVNRALGPGWGGAFDIVVEGGSRPVTDPDLLDSLAAFEQSVDADKDVATTAGVGGISRATRRLGEIDGLVSSLDRQLSTGRRNLATLDNGLDRAHAGAGTVVSGLRGATQGAHLLGGGAGQASDGASQLRDGLATAASGAKDLREGTRQASSGARRLDRGATSLRDGARRLRSALQRSTAGGAQLADGSQKLASGLHDGATQLDKLQDPVGIAQSELDKGFQALRKMSLGRTDPQYRTAIEAVGRADGAVTGKDPTNGNPVDPTYQGLQAALDSARQQLDQAAGSADQLAAGAARLEKGLAEVQRGARRLSTGSDTVHAGAVRLADALHRLGGGTDQLAPGLMRLSVQTDLLAGGLHSLDSGATNLASGLDSGAQRSTQLTTGLSRLTSGVASQKQSLGRVGSGTTRMLERSPGLFRSGYFYLASIDGASKQRRSQAQLVVNLQGGGHVARMTVIPKTGPLDPRTEQTRKRLERGAHALAADTGTSVHVGGPAATLTDYNDAMRTAVPTATVALALMTLLILIPVLRSLVLPLVAVVLNVLTVGITFGILALLFNDSFLGGPGYIDAIGVGSIITVMFGLAIDYEVFVLARMREEFVRTGNPQAAIDNGIAHTARVVTGAAMIMLAVFLTFALSSFVSIRNFGVALGIAVVLDAFLIRLVALPAIMRLLGPRSWWLPAWMERLLPRLDVEVPSVVR